MGRPDDADPSPFSVSPSPEYGVATASTTSSKGHTVSGYHPDLTDGLRQHGGNEYVYTPTSDKNSNCSGGPAALGMMQHLMGGGQFSEVRPRSEHFYEQPMVVFRPGKTASGEVSERTPFIDPGKRAGQIAPAPRASMLNPPPPHLFLSKHVDPRSVAWRSVTEQGAKISVPHANVSLSVPKDALSLAQDLYVALLDRERYQPRLGGGQTAVSPIVQCGPVDATHSLQKPVVLSVPHVVGAAADKKVLTVFYCADLDHEESEWILVYRGGSATEGDGFYIETDSSSVHMVTERLGAYLLVASVVDLNNIGGCAASMAASSSGCSSLGSPLADNLSPGTLPTVLSPGTRAALSRTLDVPSCEGNGWQQLAEAIGAANYSAYFASQPSPANALLSLWESRTRDPEPLTALAAMLRQIRRDDAIVILEREIRK